MTLAEKKRNVLIRTDEILREKGRAKGTSIDSRGRVCLSHALALATSEALRSADKNSLDYVVYPELSSALRLRASELMHQLFSSIPQFNDLSSTTDEQVFEAIQRTIQHVCPSPPEITITSVMEEIPEEKKELVAV